MVHLRKVAISADLFSHYTTSIDLDEVESLKDVIQFVVIDLHRHLEKRNLTSLCERLKMTNFHTHDYTFEEMLLESNPDRVFYVCGHASNDSK